MALVFYANGTSKDAIYSSGGKTGINPNGLMTVTVDAGAINGSSIVASANNTVKPIYWPGVNNTPNGRAISMLLRLKPGYTGTPAATRPVSLFLCGNGGRIGRLDISHNTSGNLVCTANNESGTTVINAVSFGAWSPTSTTWYDVVFTWDGTASANSAKVYVDASLIGSVTPTAALTSSWSTKYWTDISLGNGIPSINFNGASIDEMAIWDTVITPSSVALVSGTGSLNGASRTSPLSVSTFDGSINTSAGAANIRSGTAEVIAGVTITGTAAIPTAANVRSGTATDATTGTLAVPAASNVRFGTAVDATTGTARIPAAADVRSGTAVDATIGTLAVPAASNVRSGTAVDNTTGTAAIPTAANVRSGTATDATTGTLAVPAAGNVRSGTAVDNTTGTLVVPSLANTKIGVPGDGGNGTYDGSDRFTSIPEADVRFGTNYKDNSTTNNKTGLLDTPIEDDVRFGVDYDNSTKTGLLDLPVEANVADGIVFDNGTKTGTLVAASSAQAEEILNFLYMKL